MTRIVAFGLGPMRWEESIHLFALGLRTWHFGRTLAAHGHDVTVIALRKASTEGWPIAKVTTVRRSDVTVTSVSEHVGHERPAIVERILHERRPEAIVGINAYPSSVAANFVRELPFWADINGDPLAEGQARAAVYGDNESVREWHRRLWPILSRADRFSTCSEPQRFALLGELAMVGRLHGEHDGYDFACAVPNSLDAEELAALAQRARPARAPGDPFVVLWSGGYNTWADPVTLIAALELAMDVEPALRFLSVGGAIAGHDELTYRRVRQLAERSRHRDRMEFRGWVLSEELPAIYAGAHAAILVDRWSVEGLLGARTRVLDWLGAGLPVVTTELSEISRQIVARGVAHGARCGDARALGEALARLVREPEETARMGERARQLAGELTAERHLAPLLGWAAAPTRAPAGTRSLELGRPHGPLAEARKLASLVREQVLAGGPAAALVTTAGFARRVMTSWLDRAMARAGVEAATSPPPADVTPASATALAPRHGPLRWRERELEWRRRPVVGLVVYAPAGTTPDVLDWTCVHIERQYYESWRLVVIVGRGAVPELAERATAIVGRLVAAGRDASVMAAPDAFTASVTLHERLASTDYLAILGPGDLLQPDALTELLDVGVERDADVIYADEAPADATGGTHAPFHKPGWSPDFLLSFPYVGQPVLVRTELAVRHTELRPDDPPRALAYDLVLFATEHTARVEHVPRVLCRRWIPSEAPLAARLQEAQALAEAEEGALSRAIWRRRLGASIERGLRPRAHRVRFDVRGTPRVSIVIPTRDRLDLLRPCLESVERLTTWPHREILIVDNGSVEPETRAFLKECPHRVLRIDEPFNFSRLCNRGARRVKGEMLLLLNNDTRVISPGWLEAMIEHAQRPEVGAVGARLILGDGVLQHAGIAYLPTRVTYAHGRLRDVGQDAFSDVVREFSAVTAACMMMRRALYLEVGGLDEKFAVAYNDVDLCLRLRRQGLRIVYTPHAVLYHAESSSRGYGRQPAQDDVLMSRWLGVLPPDPYLGAAGLEDG